MIFKRKILSLIVFFLLLASITGSFGEMVNSNLKGQSKVNAAVTSPNVLLYSTYFGGSSNDIGLCIDRDSTNNIIIAGLTYSSDFNTTKGAFDRTYNGDSDIFVSKWSADGTDLIFSTFLGGSKHDTFRGTNYGYNTMEMTVDSEDNIIIYSTTQSTDFPTTDGAYNRAFSGVQDNIVAKLSSNGSTLLFSTFLGGSERDTTTWAGHNRLIVDAEDNIYVTGNTKSIDYPVTEGANDTTFNGGQDIFVSKLSTNGSTLLFSTFLGGVDNDYGETLAIDSEGKIIVGGITMSSDFPTTEEAYDREFDTVDGFITKISADGSNLEFSTFLGGTEWEYLTSTTIDEVDNIYCTGITWSADFPTTENAVQPNPASSRDCYITKLSANGSTLLASTYIGGYQSEYSHAIILDADGKPWIVGYTNSDDFPTESAYDDTFNGASDFFITKLTADLSALDYSTYLGGSAGDDHGWSPSEFYFNQDAGDLELIDKNNIFVIGSTRSTDFPVTEDARSKILKGGSDMFLTHLDWSPKKPSPPQNLLATPSDGKITLTWEIPSSEGSAPITGYNVYRSAESGGLYTLLTDTTELSYVDTDVSNGNEYFYVVTAINNIGESDYSNEISATPISPTTTSPTTPSTTSGDGDTPGFDLITGILVIVIVSTLTWSFRHKNRNQK
ncbi:MAG: fibronectin type III domain-containing protein [Promethearchaeota archaeon]